VAQGVIGAAHEKYFEYLLIAAFTFDYNYCAQILSFILKKACACLHQVKLLLNQNI
jgi:hypothetical protein